VKIEKYSFGHIVIDGMEYNSDVLIYPDGTVDPSWWRDEGHVLKVSDIDDLLSAKPGMIVAGTGASGVMRLQPDVQAAAEEQGIEFRAMPTEEAVSVFNEESRRQRVAACLHLTC
jgi:hypothetical protein